MTAPKPPLAQIMMWFLVLSMFCFAQTKESGESSSSGPITIAMDRVESSYFVIFNDANCEMVRITTDDGKVTFGKCYKPDEAAEIFWKYLGNKSPTVLQKRIDELEAEVKKLKAGTNVK